MRGAEVDGPFFMDSLLKVEDLLRRDVLLIQASQILAQAMFNAERSLEFLEATCFQTCPSQVSKKRF